MKMSGKGPEFNTAAFKAKVLQGKCEVFKAKLEDILKEALEAGKVINEVAREIPEEKSAQSIHIENFLNSALIVFSLGVTAYSACVAELEEMADDKA